MLGGVKEADEIQEQEKHNSVQLENVYTFDEHRWRTFQHSNDKIGDVPEHFQLPKLVRLARQMANASVRATQTKSIYKNHKLVQFTLPAFPIYWVEVVQADRVFAKDLTN